MKSPDKSPGRILIGTSGYSYGHWKGIIYPERISGRNMLQVYSQSFPAVEINYSFYHLPKEKTLRNWLSRVGPNFLFVLKVFFKIFFIFNLFQSIERTIKEFEFKDIDMGFCLHYRINSSGIGFYFC